MKKVFYLLLMMAYGCSQTALAQTEVVIKHHSYTTYYNTITKQPDSVKWVLTSSMLDCATSLARLNAFVADPQIPNTKFNIYYNGSGYDQGHQFDADDASCNTTDEAECWYFSNMVPQRPNLNRITWRTLENHTRALAGTQTVNVSCGVIGSLGMLVGSENKKQKDGTKITVKHPSTINIPAYCWKRLQYGNTVEFYIMPNQDSVSNHPYTFYKIK